MDPVLIPIGIGLYLMFAGKKKKPEDSLTIVDEDVYTMPDADTGPSMGPPSTILVTPPPSLPPVIVIPPYIPPTPTDPTPPSDPPDVPPVVVLTPPTFPEGPTTNPPAGEYEWGTVVRHPLTGQIQFAPNQRVFHMKNLDGRAVDVFVANDSWNIISASGRGWSHPGPQALDSLAGMLGMWEN